MFKWLFKKKGCAKHMNNKLEVIGIDHGWSMMKTISQVFVTGVKEITTTPALFGDVLEYEGKFYKVGTVRQEVKDTKVEDDSFYLLTLAAVAKELKRRGLAEAKVFLAVGLPLEYKDQTVTVQYESTTIENTRQKADVSVVKKDSDTETSLDGGKYTLYAGNDIKNYAGQVIVTKGTALETVTTGEDGKASYSVDLPISNGYYIQETQAPYAYIRNSKDVYSFNFNVLPETQAKASFSHTFVNDRTTAKIHIYKVDKESGKAVAQGDASLEGAVYGLYARNDIVHPDGATGVVFKAGDLVATLTTDKNGEAEVNNLYLGNYYVKEITPSEGYLLDEEEHDVVCDYEGDLVAEVSRSTTSAEQVIKQPFQLIKVSDNGDDTEAGLLAGAEFTAYLKSSLSVKADGSYDFDKATPVVIGENGATTITSDDKGHAVSIAIPYGTYVVVESKTPHNMKTIKPFEVKIKENHPTEPQTWRVFLDREFTAKLRVIKKDSDTKQTVLVPNAEFKIFNIDKNEYVTQYTTYELTNRFTPIYQKSSGAIYLALKSLCERELVSRESELFAGRIRVYYALSSEGRIYLGNLRDKLDLELKNLQSLLKN